VKKSICVFVCLMGVVSFVFAEVTLTQNETWGGQGGMYKVVTEKATFYYHPAGGIMVGVVDAAGKDWVGWNKSGSNDAGVWRGLFKPVFNWGWSAQSAAGAGVSSTVSEESDDYVKVSSSKGGNATTWEFYPTCATMTVTAAGQSYYFTYEGAPNGAFSKTNNLVGIGTEDEPHEIGSYSSSNDIGVNDGETWEWAYLGDKNSENVMFMVHHDDDTKGDDFSSGWGNMCVLAFGRKISSGGSGAFFTAADEVFSVGIVESTEKADIAAAVKVAVTGETSARPRAASKTVRGLALRQVGDELMVAMPFAGQSTVTIHDLAGRALISQVSDKAASTINTASFPSGSYIVKATQGERVLTGKISKF